MIFKNHQNSIKGLRRLSVLKTSLSVDLGLGSALACLLDVRVLQVCPRLFLVKIGWRDCLSAELIIEGSSTSRGGNAGVCVCVCVCLCVCVEEGGGQDLPHHAWATPPAASLVSSLPL